jgi:ADP-ribose pyrophosphatase YjhB (NUDIX family)
MKRSDNAHWGLPGGYVEVGESVVEATKREVREETGYEIEVGRLVGVYSDPSVQVIRYADDPGAPGAPSTPEETLEVGFFDEGALPGPFVPIHEIRVADALAGAAQASIR